jgi:hypothetical protein
MHFAVARVCLALMWATITMQRGVQSVDSLRRVLPGETIGRVSLARLASISLARPEARDRNSKAPQIASVQQNTLTDILTIHGWLSLDDARLTTTLTCFVLKMYTLLPRCRGWGVGAPFSLHPFRY